MKWGLLLAINRIQIVLITGDVLYSYRNVDNRTRAHTLVFLLISGHT